MTYTALIAGTVYSTDPIQYVDAYARATFSDTTVLNYSLSETNPRALNFHLIAPQKLDASTKLEDLQEGLIVGSDSNVRWDLTVTRGED